MLSTVNILAGRPGVRINKLFEKKNRETGQKEQFLGSQEFLQLQNISWHFLTFQHSAHLQGVKSKVGALPLQSVGRRKGGLQLLLNPQLFAPSVRSVASTPPFTRATNRSLHLPFFLGLKNISLLILSVPIRDNFFSETLETIQSRVSR